MNWLLIHGILLAQQSRLESLGSGFRKSGRRIDSGDVLVGIVIFAGVMLGLWLLAYFLAPQKRRWRGNSPLRLFCTLCKAHDLRWVEWWLLWRVARQQRLQDPVRLFLDPERLDPAALGPGLQTQAERVSSIRARLFADLPNDPKPPLSAQEAASSPTPRAKREKSPLFAPLGNPTLDLPLWSSPAQSSPESAKIDLQ